MVKDGDQNLQIYSEFFPKNFDFVQDHIDLKLLNNYNPINLLKSICSYFLYKNVVKSTYWKLKIKNGIEKFYS